MHLSAANHSNSGVQPYLGPLEGNGGPTKTEDLKVLASLVGMEHMSERSPKVLGHSWGELEVEGLGKYGDAELWPGGGREWNWAETGTHHQPGIQPTDLEELLTFEPEVVVLSRGRELRLGVCPQTLSLLKAHGVAVIIEETSVAISMYNDEVVGTRRVAALIHSTC